MEEAWLRGPIDGIDPLLMPVAHALVQVPRTSSASLATCRRITRGSARAARR